MQRYFALNKNLELDKQDVFHITKVMRMKIDDKIEIVFDKKEYEDVKVINELVPKLKSEGYQFVTVSELYEIKKIRNAKN